MPFNLIKKYPQLLELGMDERGNRQSLQRIFDRDITNNEHFSYDGKRIYPIKTDGRVDMEREFQHLTTVESTEIVDGKEVVHRIFDKERSMRLHWIRTHIDKQVQDSDIIVFSHSERRNRTNVIRTYIYNQTRKYVIVFEPQKRNGYNSYYLLTAYYLDKSYGEKQIKKKLKAKLDTVL